MVLQCHLQAMPKWAALYEITRLTPLKSFFNRTEIIFFCNGKNIYVLIRVRLRVVLP